MAVNSTLHHGVYPLWKRFRETSDYLEVVKMFIDVVDDETETLERKRAVADEHYCEGLKEILCFLGEYV